MLNIVTASFRSLPGIWSSAQGWTLFDHRELSLHLRRRKGFHIPIYYIFNLVQYLYVLYVSIVLNEHILPANCSNRWKFINTLWYMYIHTCIHTYIDRHISMQTLWYTYIHIHTHSYIHTLIDIHRYTLICIYMHTYIHTHIYVIHTYIHTFKGSDWPRWGFPGTYPLRISAKRNPLIA